MIVQGYIQDYSPENQLLTIVAPFNNPALLEYQGISEVEIRLNDNRRITNKQRRKIFALVNDIGRFTSGIQSRHEYAEALREMQLLYVIDSSNSEVIRTQLTLSYCELLDIDVFSLSDVDVSTARDFIDWLVEMCVKHTIPCNDVLINRCEDIGRLVYNCLLFKRCAVCGRPAQLHHVDAVGMGRDRHDIPHIGLLSLPLCSAGDYNDIPHHSEIHNIGDNAFIDKYHLVPVKLDERLCEVYKMRG